MSGKSLSESAATGGAAGLSALGAVVGLCCVGPWSVALFGVGGAVLLNRLEPFRPLILIAASALLGWAFWRVYRPQPAAAACVKRQAPILKTALWISAALLLLAFFARDFQWLFVNLTPAGAIK